MRLTVGPLPPTVYWRRRAVVLGAVLLFLIVLFYSCNGPTGGNDATGDGKPDPGVATGTPDPTGSVLTPQTGSPPSGDAGADPANPGGEGETADAGDEPENEPSLSNDPPAADPVVDEGNCADTELSVTAVASPAEAASGASVDLSLKIRNRSDRTCSRDVGATAQELYIKAGAEVVWSSDTCGTAAGSDVQSFTPGFERSYQVSWNGRGSSRCANGVANGPVVQAGRYEVFARVGTKLSQPAKLVIS
ncbi:MULTISPECIES: hypothetical protein [unclassified Micromonospora]|uniref:hypothetical protein n=1 Tax=unclassified Micromonospora TaxID=2617518 RepID=UPI0022B63950|nr:MULTISPECIES: hypothetical protein [unclassified Micromonospora]MCZ7419418.1 hypothetical protein [Verrucosispora sp. WMMA2121]WBB93060.1 hypothetical protein O7597_08820 [Verrucosispora sp. WMMC514]